MSYSSEAEAFFGYMNRRELDKIRECLDAEAVFFFPKTQPLTGPDRIVKFLQILFRGYPELVFTVQGVVSDGDTAAVHWTNRGHNRKQELYANEGVTWFRFQDGKVVFLSDFFKDTGKF